MESPEKIAKFISEGFPLEGKEPETLIGYHRALNHITAERREAEWAISDLQNRFDRDREKRNKAEEELILVKQELAASVNTGRDFAKQCDKFSEEIQNLRARCRELEEALKELYRQEYPGDMQFFEGDFQKFLAKALKPQAQEEEGPV